MILDLAEVQELVKEINELVYKEVWTLDELERQLKQVVFRLGALLLRVALERLDEELRSSRCGRCGDW